MNIIRNQEIIICGISDLKSGDCVYCNNFEELVTLCRDLSYSKVEYRQIEPGKVLVV